MTNPSRILPKKVNEIYKLIKMEKKQANLHGPIVT